MSLAIILDKSTFQGLSFSELIQLNKYFIFNATPLLIAEILGDLSKEQMEGKIAPKDQVVTLSTKIFPAQTYVNENYKRLLELSLLGKFTDPSNRPFLEATKSVNTGDKQGLVFEEPEYEKNVRRWKDGDFKEMDEVESWFWRKKTTAETVIENFKERFKLFEHIKNKGKGGNTFDNLVLLRDELLKELNRPEAQQEYLSLIIDFYGIDAAIAGEIFHRWETHGYKNLADFSQYGLYCLTIVAMYYTGINNHLLGEKKTNLLDLEYLYYAPFCRVFSSNDDFLVTLFKLIIPKDVEFISTPALKTELAAFHRHEEETGEKTDLPPLKDTEIYRIFDKVLNLKMHEFLKANPRPQEELIAEFEAILKASEEGKEGAFAGEPTFVTKTFYMRPDDPCPCGSGKPLKDCHAQKQ